ncbi:hypothetical protein KTO58_01165 [Chitinophaga pendula]|uniref:hypothetical protein n=1 Tax=Chitinophaga TaxID=79328 RepID=UPI000BB00ABF|nr:MULTISPECIES: hypothetical protein [Chitinophaga]ASZ14530.1 hypothetical protein CK934_28065 [Chitinophaga sp. MD30]UCJ07815.1 hypothetical protein KTO58_01165 [Chitinophaga pendula]
MITIKTTDLKEFIRLAKGVTRNSIIPVLQYVMCRCVGDTMTLCKSNQETVVSHDISAEFDENISFLVDDKTLTAFVATAEDEVSIRLNGNKVTLISGSVTIDTFYPNGGEKDYPDPPTAVSDTSYLLNRHVLKSIAVAGTYLSALDNNPLSFCYILPAEDRSVIVGTDAHILYLTEIAISLPNIVLSKEATVLVGAFDKLQYFSYQNYNVFNAGKTTYAFIKPTYTALPYKRVLDSATSPGRMTVNRKDIIRFCEAALGVSTCKWTIGTLSNSDDGLTLGYYEESVSLSNVITAEKNFVPAVFNFNTRLLLHVFKSLPGEYLSLQPGERANGTMYFVRSEQEASTVALINGLV